MRARLDCSPPLIRFDLFGEQAEQCCLAGSIAADQRQPVARADMQVQPAKQPAGALIKAEIFERQDGCSHGGDLGGKAGRLKPDQP